MSDDDYDDFDYMRRSIAAYHRSGGGDINRPIYSAVKTCGGLRYAVLRDDMRDIIVAVYRINTNRGVLRRLRRFPAALKQEAA